MASSKRTLKSDIDRKNSVLFADSDSELDFSVVENEEKMEIDESMPDSDHESEEK